MHTRNVVLYARSTKYGEVFFLSYCPRIQRRIIASLVRRKVNIFSYFLCLKQDNLNL